MKVLLMNPLSAARGQEFCDIGLGYLASGVREAGHTVILLLRPLSEDGFVSLLGRERPDVVGIKVFSTNVRQAVRTVALARAAGCGCIVAGGPHVNGDPSNALVSIPADYAFQGEADRSFPRFLDVLARGATAELKTLPGLIHRDGGAVATSPPEVITSLDDLPFPAWDLMPPARYRSLVSRRRPAASVLTSRGCTNRCSFCAESLRALRHRSPGNVVAEIRMLAERHGVREIQFLDSNFISRKDYIMALCRLLIEEKLPLALCAPNGTRLEAVDDEICALLARAGFYRVNVGIESGSPDVLRSVRKGIDLARVAEKVALFRKHGIQVVGNFMLGFPGETKEQMEQTLALSLSLDLTGVNFSVYVPMPGTELYGRLAREGTLAEDRAQADYNYFSYRNGLSALSPEELKRFRNRCFLRFLLRPRTITIVRELLASGVLTGNLFSRLYGMYIAPFLSERKKTLPGEKLRPGDR